MLINFSHHVHTQWSEKQLQKAIDLYQEIIDIPFPNVEPEGDEIYIQNLADEYLNQILEIQQQNADKSITVHLMGEYTFCFALLKKLQAHNITCVASTTKRIVQMTEDQKKISVFEFVQFRKFL